MAIHSWRQLQLYFQHHVDIRMCDADNTVAEGFNMTSPCRHTYLCVLGKETTMKVNSSYDLFRSEYSGSYMYQYSFLLTYFVCYVTFCGAPSFHLHDAIVLVPLVCIPTFVHHDHSQPSWCFTSSSHFDSAHISVS